MEPAFEPFLARPMRSGGPLLIMLSGLPGSGKSTWARRLAKAIGADHVETDRLRRAIFPVRTYSGKEHAVVYRAAFEAVRRALSQGKHGILDATNLTDSARQPARALAEKLDVGLAIVVFVPAEEEIRRRLASRFERPDPADLSEAGIAVFEELRARFRPVVGPHWQITTDTEADQALAALVRLLAV